MNDSRSLCFPAMERLKNRDAIRRVFKNGRCVTCKGARLFCLESGLEHNRIAFTFVRKFGNAVERNRARRLGREAYRHLRSRLKRAFDIVLLVYPEEIVFSGRLKQLDSLFHKAGIYA